MSNKNLKGGIIIGYLSLFSSIAISLIYIPYLYKSLGVTQLSIYNLSVAITGYFGVLNMGLGSAYIRFYSKFSNTNNEDSLKILNGIFLKIFAIISLFVLIVGSILLFNLGNIFQQYQTSELNDFRITLALMLFNLGITLPASIFESNIIVNEKFILNKSLNLARIIMQPLLIVILLYLGYKTVTIALLQLILSVIIITINVHFCVKKLGFKISNKKTSLISFKEIFVFSIFIFATILVDQVNWAVDKVILGINSTKMELNLYTTGALFNYYLILFSYAIGGVFAPKINNIIFGSKNINTEISELFAKVGRMQFFILFLYLSSFIFFGQDFLNLYLGRDFKKSYYVTVILMCGVFIPLFQSIGQEITRSKNLHRYSSIVFICIAIINILLSIPLARSYGAIGPALATAGCVFIGEVIFMNIFYHKKVGINIIYFWKEIFKIIPSLIIPVISGIIIYQFMDTSKILNLIIFGAMYILIYLTSLYFFGLNSNELPMINSLIKKILRK